MLKSPGPIAIDFGPVQIYWYGIIIALAFLTGLGISLRVAGKNKLDKEHILNLAVYLLIGAITGARLYFVLFNWDYYSNHLAEILMTWKGGLSIHGAILGGLITTAIYTRKHKLSLLKYTDVFVFGLSIGQAIGRWGNFFNSEAFGTPTDLPWKLYIPVESRPPEYQQYQYFHPAFLYESLWNILVFCFLYFILRKKLQKYNGALTFSYLILYSIGRIMIEGIRTDSIFFVFGIPLAQFVGIITIIIGFAGLIFVTVYRKQAGQQ